MPKRYENNDIKKKRRFLRYVKENPQADAHKTLHNQIKQAKKERERERQNDLHSADNG